MFLKRVIVIGVPGLLSSSTLRKTQVEDDIRLFVEKRTSSLICLRSESIKLQIRNSGSVITLTYTRKKKMSLTANYLFEHDDTLTFSFTKRPGFVRHCHLHIHIIVFCNVTMPI